MITNPEERAELLKKRQAEYVDMIRQHKQMFQQFPAYRAMLQQIQKNINELDANWESTPKEEHDLKRGKKMAYKEMSGYLKSFLEKQVSEE